MTLTMPDTVHRDHAAGKVLDEQAVVRLALLRLGVEVRVDDGDAQLLADQPQRRAAVAAVDASPAALRKEQDGAQLPAIVRGHDQIRLEGAQPAEKRALFGGRGMAHQFLHARCPACQRAGWRPPGRSSSRHSLPEASSGAGRGVQVADPVAVVRR